LYVLLKLLCRTPNALTEVTTDLLVLYAWDVLPRTVTVRTLQQLAQLPSGASLLNAPLDRHPLLGAADGATVLVALCAGLDHVELLRTTPATDAETAAWLTTLTLVDRRTHLRGLLLRLGDAAGVHIGPLDIILPLLDDDELLAIRSRWLAEPWALLHALVPHLTAAAEHR